MIAKPAYLKLSCVKSVDNPSANAELGQVLPLEGIDLFLANTSLKIFIEIRNQL